jgi:hypothetical protein
MAEYNKVYASLKPELPKVIQQEQIYVYAPKSSRSGMKSISSFNITAPVSSVQYDTTDGITVTGNSSLASEEVSGETATQNFQSEFKIPIRPGKYINIDATADNDAVEVKADETALGEDYYKIDKNQTSSTIPYWDGANSGTLKATSDSVGNSIVQRDGNGDCSFHRIKVENSISDSSGNYNTDARDLAYAAVATFTEHKITKTETDTGSVYPGILAILRAYPQIHIQYDNKIYYRMDPLSASNGTLNYIHIDSVQKGTGGYTATGKCFSITVSTREWKVFDLEFGGSGSGTGNDLEQIVREASNTAQSVSYDSTSGATIEYTYKTLIYKDSTTGETKSTAYPAQLSLPILPGKYISMDANSENDALEVKVDDTALAPDYIKISKTLAADSSPVIEGGITVWYPTTQYPQGKSFAWRNNEGDCSFRYVKIDGISNKSSTQVISYWNIWRNIYDEALTITETFTNTGTLTSSDLEQLQAPGYYMVKYDNQLYYRYDPRNAPDGTLNYIHIDSIQDDNSGYKATGKCFSVTVSTREWQVVDLDFGGSTRTTHNLTLNNSATGTNIYFSLTDNRTETYEGAPAGLWAALENSPIACTVDNDLAYAAGIITIDGDNFKVMYGNCEELLMTQTQVTITDSLV